MHTNSKNRSCRVHTAQSLLLLFNKFNSLNTAHARVKDPLTKQVIRQLTLTNTRHLYSFWTNCLKSASSRVRDSGVSSPKSHARCSQGRETNASARRTRERIMSVSKLYSSIRGRNGVVGLSKCITK